MWLQPSRQSGLGVVLIGSALDQEAEAPFTGSVWA